MIAYSILTPLSRSETYVDEPDVANVQLLDRVASNIKRKVGHGLGHLSHD